MTKTKKTKIDEALDEVAKKAAKGVDTAVRGNVDDMRKLDGHITRHLRGIMVKLFKGAQATDIVTPRDMAKALGAIKSAVKAMEKDVAPGMHAVISANAEAVAPYAIRAVYDANAVAVAIVGARKLERTVDKVKILDDAKKLYWPRFRTSSVRYAGSIGERIRAIMAASSAAGESWGVMAQRLANSPIYRDVVEREERSWGRAIGPRIAEGSSAVSRHWAQRLVRTEASYAYGVIHNEMIRFADSVDPGYARKWSAAPDYGRTCPICQALDNTVAELDGTFTAGYRDVPAHPNCRCVVVAWRREWAKGIPPVESAPPPTPVPAVPRGVPVGAREAFGRTFHAVEPEAPLMTGKRAQAMGKAFEPLRKAKPPSKAEQKRLRDYLRASVEEYGFVDRRAWINSVADPDVYNVKELKDGVAGTLSGNDGAMTIRPSYAQRADFLARKVAAGEPVAAIVKSKDAPREIAGDVHAYHIHVHEAMHEYGPMPKSWIGYSKQGIDIEEVATEVTARRITRDHLGLALHDAPYLGVPVEGVHAGSYDDKIVRFMNGLLRGIEDATSSKYRYHFSDEEAFRMIERASLRFKSMARAADVVSAEAMTTAFVESIDFDEIAKALDITISEPHRYEMAQAIADRITDAKFHTEEMAKRLRATEERAAKRKAKEK